MKLTNDQVKALTHGALWYDEDREGYLHFYRFTEKQIAFYQETNTDFYYKTMATSNVRIACTTDATALSFAYTAHKRSSRKFCYFDVYAGGVMIAHEGVDGCEEATGRVQVALPTGVKEVVLYLPPLFGAAIKDLTLENATFAAPVEKTRKMLIVGDSITQGYDAVYPSQSYANLIADMLDATSVNQGIGAEIFNPDIIDADLGFTPDLITVAYGTNDYSKRTREDFTAAANEYYAKLRRAFPTAKIFALLPIWRGDTAKPRPVGSFEKAKAIVRAAAEAQPNTVVIDGNTFVPHLPEFFSDKHLHPNDMGFKFYADALLAAMIKEL